MLPHHPRSWALHLQAHGPWLLVAEAFDFRSTMPDSEYYRRAVGGMDSSRFGERGLDYSAGIRVYDISHPAQPRAVSFLEVPGLGVHRIWWTGGRYAYASTLLDGFSDHILIVVDLIDPVQPTVVGRSKASPVRPSCSVAWVRVSVRPLALAISSG